MILSYRKGFNAITEGFSHHSRLMIGKEPSRGSHKIAIKLMETDRAFSKKHGLTCSPLEQSKAKKIEHGGLALSERKISS